MKYDFERGSFPSGRYIVGEDIPLGKYILRPTNSANAGSIFTYSSYEDFQANGNYTAFDFDEEFFVSFKENGYIMVQNASMQKV